MEDKNKEAQLVEEETKKVTGGAINPLGGGILDNNDPAKPGMPAPTGTDEYQPDLVGIRWS